MQHILQTDVPRCPHCSALLFSVERKQHVYFCCPECNSIWQVIGEFNADNEVVISDSPEESNHLL